MWSFPYYTNQWDFIKNQFGWISDLENTLQDSIHHAEGNVAIHLKMVLDALFHHKEFLDSSELNKNILFTSALFHDIEKRSTTKSENSGITSKGHAKKGELAVRKILYTEIPTPFHIREQIAKIVRYHGLPLWILEKENPEKSLIEASILTDTEKLKLIAEVDILGRITEDKETLFYKLDLWKEFCKEYDCYGKSRKFHNDISRFTYFRKEKSPIDYVPFDDTKFTVILMSGLPGSGKDFYIKKNLHGIPVVSIDNIREEYDLDPTDSTDNGNAIRMAKEKAKGYMRKRIDFVWNATNTTKQMRGQLIDMFCSYGAKIKIIYIESPYKKVMEQNRERENRVPEKIITKLIGKLEIPNLTEAHEVEYVFS